MLQKRSVTDLGMMYTLQELNNPITNILLCLDLLETSAADGKKTSYYDIIKKNALAMGASVKDMYSCLAERQEFARSGQKGKTLGEMIHLKKTKLNL